MGSEDDGALLAGAQAVWVGTRFVATVEANAPKEHKEAVLSAGHEDSVKTVIFTGRPLRARITPYIEDWWVMVSFSGRFQ